MAEVLDRAAALYEAIFTDDDRCIVIAQEWPSDDTPLRYTNLFSTPGTGLPDAQGSYGVSAREESGDDHSHTLRWSEVAARDFQYRTILLGIGNADHGLVPAISGRVYFLNAERGLLMHMYDDRGLDVIAREAEPLRGIYKEFNSWILDYDRSQIDQVFKPVQH
jgi:hypothetical protein